jgi:molecular chaperone GrpE
MCEQTLNDEILDDADEAEYDLLDEPEAETATDYEKQYHDMLNRYQRTLAEFDNFRKRTIKEKASLYDDGLRSVVEKLLPVVDNFERALKTTESGDDPFYQGMAMIARQLDTMLADMGVSVIPAVGEGFDHNVHFAVAHVEDEGFGANEVIEEMQKGYKHKDRVIRPSMVKVAN